jgi:hypothetical protein
MTGIHEAHLWKMTLFKELGYLSKGDQEDSYITKFAFDRYKTKICPLCIKEKQYLKKVWDYSIFIMCHIHGCLLINTCPKCNRKINHHMSSFILCKCGFDFRTVDLNVDNNSMEKFFYRLYFSNKPKDLAKNKDNPLSNLSFKKSLYYYLSYLILFILLNQLKMRIFSTERIR